MNARPDAEFGAFLSGVRRRTRYRTALVAGAAALIGAAVVVVASGSIRPTAAVLAVSIGASAIAGLIAWLVAGGSTHRLAADVERRRPSCRNLLITAAELGGAGSAVPEYVRSRVLSDAARLSRTLDLRTLVPIRAGWRMAAAAIVVWSAALAWAAVRGPVGTESRPSSASAAAINGITVEVTPPAYTQRPSQTFRDPSRIEVLAGSRLHVAVAADAARLELETVAGRQPAESTGARTFAATVLADADGYIAIAPTATDGTVGTRRLIGLSVTTDELPRLRITAPGKDLLLPSGNHTVQVEIDAKDDLGLASLQLFFTRVAGSGESFTFTEGEVPLDVTKTDERGWTGHARWRLDPQGLQPGDMLIYRARASDKRPGAPMAESDTFIVEIVAPGALASEGFAIDDREEKYAISQQMVILKTERLLANRKSLSAEEFREQALDLAAEQRQVRAEFVFMMGGELADAGLDLNMLHEEEEAHGEEDIAAGRLANRGRLDLTRAIRAMSRAATRLAEPDVAGALPIEKDALKFLQGAFSRSRYILRTLGERERLDLSRRLTGVLAALARPVRPALEPAPDPRIVALRRALADLAALSVDLRRDSTSAGARAAELAQRILTVDPGSTTLAEVSSALATPGSLTAAAIDRAAAAIAGLVRAELGAAPDRTADPAEAALAGALADERRRSGVRR